MQPRTQSALHPAADSGAALIDQLGQVLYIGAAAIFVVVMVLALTASIERRQVDARNMGGFGGGLVFPVVTLTALLMYSLAVGNGLDAIGSQCTAAVSRCFGADERVAQDRLRVHVESSASNGGGKCATSSPARDAHRACERNPHCRSDRPVELVLSTTDVIHSFWVPSLAGKVDMIPGRTPAALADERAGHVSRAVRRILRRPARVDGVVRGTQSPKRVRRMARAAGAPVSAPRDAVPATRPRRILQRRLPRRATRSAARRRADTLGPDLTHVGSRKSLGAGVLDNHIGTMAGWIAGARTSSPAITMPSMPIFTARSCARCRHGWEVSNEARSR